MRKEELYMFITKFEMGAAEYTDERARNVICMWNEFVGSMGYSEQVFFEWDELPGLYANGWEGVAYYLGDSVCWWRGECDYFRVNAYLNYAARFSVVEAFEEIRGSDEYVDFIAWLMKEEM